MVLELLSTVHQLQVPVHSLGTTEREALIDFSLKQSKSAKIEEWKRLPLSSEAQRRAWVDDRHGLIQAQEHGRNRVDENIGSEATSAQITNGWEVSSLVPPSFQELPASTGMAQPQSEHMNDMHIGIWGQGLPSLPELSQGQSHRVTGSARGMAFVEVEGAGSSPNSIAHTPQDTAGDSTNSCDSRWRKYF